MRVLLTLAVGFLASASSAQAGFTNGSFETGSFAGWTTIGTTAVAFEPYTTGISAPSQGAFQAGALTGGASGQAALEAFFGILNLDASLGRDAFAGGVASPHLAHSAASAADVAHLDLAGATQLHERLSALLRVGIAARAPDAR